MERILSALEPEEVFFWFEEVSRIPRESGKEKKISDYIVDFAKQRGLKVYQDQQLNVIIEKNATEGYEKAKKVLLQGHMDMVCVKDDNIDHDFDKDPISLVIDGDYIKAKGTSLGADNGNAIALCLALLDSKKIKHPALQVLLTTQEETTLAGAENVDPKLLDAEYYIGLDFSKDRKLLVSCAGSSANHITIPINRSKTEAGIVLEVKLSGLSGGHSGNDIAKNRANANVVLSEVLRQTLRIKRYRLIEINGGRQDNVICQSAEAKILISASDVEEVCQKIKNSFKVQKTLYNQTDPQMELQIKKGSSQQKVISAEDTEKILSMITCMPDGLYALETVPEIVPITSSNLGIVRTEEEALTLDILVRSNSDALHEEIISLIKKTACDFNARHYVDQKTLAWQSEKNSRLIETARRVYKKNFNENLDTLSIHAQVEVGIILEKIKQIGRNMEAIGIGVLTYDVHSTKERVYIPSLRRTYELLCSILEALNQ